MMTETGAMLPAQSPHLLTVGVGLAAIWAMVALCMQFLRSRSFGRRTFFASPADAPRRAVAYAFGAGMLPGAKESVRTHLPLWTAGIAFHLGALAGFLLLSLSILQTQMELLPLRMLQIGSLIGAIAGTVLLARRFLDRVLRGLSHPDDYVANLLTSGFAALAFATTIRPAAGPWFLGSAVLLLVYLPLGKIRHCVFFFPARYHSAVFFGRRGAYPPHA